LVVGAFAKILASALVVAYVAVAAGAVSGVSNAMPIERSVTDTAATNSTMRFIIGYLPLGIVSKCAV